MPVNLQAKSSYLDNFIDNLQAKNERGLAKWLLSPDFIQDYRKIYAEIQPNIQNEKIAEIAQIMQRLKELRTGYIRSERAKRIVRITTVLAIGLAIGLDIAFTGGVGTIVSLSITQPVIIAPALAFVATLVVIAPKLFSNLASIFYQRSEKSVYSCCAKIYSETLGGHESLPKLANLAKNLEAGWFSNSTRKNTIGDIAKQCINKIATNSDHHKLVNTTSNSLFGYLSGWLFGSAPEAKAQAAPTPTTSPTTIKTPDNNSIITPAPLLPSKSKARYQDPLTPFLDALKERNTR